MYMQGKSGVSCWQNFLCVCRGWRGAYTCEASALGSAVKILSAAHPNHSPGLGLWTGYTMLTTCPLICLIGAAQTVFMSGHPEKRVFVRHTVDVTALCQKQHHLGLWQPQGLSGSVAYGNSSPRVTHWLGCSTLDLASPLESFIHSVRKRLLNRLSSGTAIPLTLGVNSATELCTRHFTQ